MHEIYYVLEKRFNILFFGSKYIYVHIHIGIRKGKREAKEWEDCNVNLTIIITGNSEYS